MSVSAISSACSGATKQDVLADSMASSSSGGNGDAGSSGSSGTSSGGSSSSSSSSSSGGSSSGFVPTGPCVPEEESNDGRQDANEFTTAICGTLSPSDKRDFLLFHVKPTAKSMALYFSGSVRLRVDVDGEVTTELLPGAEGVVPFVRDADYSVEVTALTDTKNTIDWRVDVVEQKSAQLLPRWNANPEDVQKSVAQLVLALVEFLRQLLERQAIRRMEAETLESQDVERIGLALMRLEETVH
ncbi:MAG TPA: gas vesicle protein K, partial [Labilithrix sp.]|nr:gas vesicle protein K [Labilithrix sp.]